MSASAVDRFSDEQGAPAAYDPAEHRLRRLVLPERPAELRAVFHGELTSATARDWRERLIALAARRPRLLTIDLRRVSSVDASVIVTIRALERRLSAGKGLVALLAPPHLASVLQRMGVDHLLADGDSA